MIILIIGAVLIGLGIITSFFADVCYNPLPLISFVFGALILNVSSIILVAKPIDRAHFQAEYDSVSEMIEWRNGSVDVFTDVTLGNRVTEVNTIIRAHRRLCDNVVVGIFYDKKVAAYELLSLSNDN